MKCGSWTHCEHLGKPGPLLARPHRFLNNVGFFFPLIMMLTWMVSVASMVRKLVYEREIQLEEASGLGEGKGQQLGVTGYPVCLAGSH